MTPFFIGRAATMSLNDIQKDTEASGIVHI